MSTRNSDRASIWGCRHVIAALLIALPLAACQGHGRVAGTVPGPAYQSHPGTAETIALDLQTTPHGMSEREREEVYSFISAYRQEGQGRLQVAAPSGSANEGESHLVVGEVRRIARDSGLSTGTIDFSAYRATEPRPPVTLSYERFVSYAGCGQWPTNLAEGWHNRPYENFGCATRNNLAVMVEDPRDLHFPRAATARDSSRRDTIFERHRAGENTAAKTGTDDASTASNIGQ